jgi:hypothetical protein
MLDGADGDATDPRDDDEIDEGVLDDDPLADDESERAEAPERRCARCRYVLRTARIGRCSECGLHYGVNAVTFRCWGRTANVAIGLACIALSLVVFVDSRSRGQPWADGLWVVLIVGLMVYSGVRSLKHPGFVVAFEDGLALHWRDTHKLLPWAAIDGLRLKGDSIVFRDARAGERYALYSRFLRRGDPHKTLEELLSVRPAGADDGARTDGR